MRGYHKWGVWKRESARSRGGLRLWLLISSQHGNLRRVTAFRLISHHKSEVRALFDVRSDTIIAPTRHGVVL